MTDFDPYFELGYVEHRAIKARGDEQVAWAVTLFNLAQRFAQGFIEDNEA